MPVDDGGWNVPVRQLAAHLVEGKVTRRFFLHRATLLGLSVAAAREVAGLPAAAAPAAPLPRGGVLRHQLLISDISAPATFEWWDKSQNVSAVCDWACFVGADGLIRGGLLQSWQPSPDLRTWTFRLRPGVTWRSGRKLVAEDIVWNLKRWLDPAVGSPYSGAVSSYLTVEKDGHRLAWDANWIEAPDDATVRLHLKTPQISVAQDLYSECALILDPHENGVFGPGSNGTGPFELVSHQVGQLSVLKARTGSWRGTPHVDEVQFIDLGGDVTAQSSALISGQVDGLYRIGFEQKILLDQVPTTKVYAAQSSQSCVARMKCNQKPFDDPRVRKAMRLAIDTSRVLQLSQGGTGLTAEHHHVCPIQPDYAKLPPMRPDPAQARALLAQAGHPNGFETAIACYDDSGPFIKAVTVMVEMWQAIGVKVNIQQLPQTIYMERWKDFPFGYTLWEDRPLGVVTLALAYRSGMPWNESHYSNPQFDATLERALAEVDDVKRRPIMAELERILQEDGPIVQAAWTPHLTAYSDKVQGVRPHPVGYIALEELALVA